MCHRQLVFCPRYEAYEEPVGSSAEGPCSFPVAVEDSASAERSGGLTEPRGSNQSSTAGGQLEHAERASIAHDAAEEGSHLVALSGTDDGQGSHADRNSTAAEDTPLLAQSSLSPDQVSVQAGALLARTHQQQIAVTAGEEQSDHGSFASSSAPREEQGSSTASAHQPQQTSGGQHTGVQPTPFYSAAAAAPTESSTAAVHSSVSTAASPMQEPSASSPTTAADAKLLGRRMSSCPGNNHSQPRAAARCRHRQQQHSRHRGQAAGAPAQASDQAEAGTTMGQASSLPAGPRPARPGPGLCTGCASLCAAPAQRAGQRSAQTTAVQEGWPL